MTAPTFKSGTPETHVQFENGWIHNHRGGREVNVRITPQEAVAFASVLLQYAAPTLKRVSEPVLVEHTGPYRSNVTFITTPGIQASTVFRLFEGGAITEAERDAAIDAIAAGA